MTWHKVDKYIPMAPSVATYRRGEKKGSRVFRMGELDGFYVDNELDRTVHITFEKKEVIVIDIYDTARAAHKPVGETIGIIELNLDTGEAKFFRDGR